MNQYKMDWYLATQSVSNYVMNRIYSDQEKPTEHSHPSIVMDYALEQAGRAVMTWAIPTIMKHLSQNQIKGTIGVMGRVGGRVGLRVVPVLGTVMIIKDALDVYEYLTDACYQTMHKLCHLWEDILRCKKQLCF